MDFEKIEVYVVAEVESTQKDTEFRRRKIFRRIGLTSIIVLRLRLIFDSTRSVIETIPTFFHKVFEFAT